jgi:predicted dehydrogenase
MNTSSCITRRSFLATAAGGAASFLILPRRSALGFQANERLNLGIIGVGGYAAAVAFVPAIHLYENAGITALCDVDQRKVVPALEMWKQRAGAWPGSDKPEEKRAAPHYQRLAEKTPPLFEDYRRMFDRMGRDIDAVVVATPDHSHTPAAAEAMHHGKHVLAEKPLCITVHEARGLRALALKQKLATSMGNQGTQSGQFRRGVELIREGALGRVEQVHIWFNRGGRNLQRPPQGVQPVPAELNWDMWLGSVAWREYHREWIARNHWRDTGIGELGNFGPHSANLAFMALKLADLWEPGPGPRPVIRVQAEASSINRLSFPAWERIRWQVPARGDMPPVTFTWHQGPDHAPGTPQIITGLMRERGASDEEISKLFLYAGAMIIGSEGAIVTDSHNVGIHLFPREKFKDVEKSRPLTIPSSRGHYRDWMDACRGGPAPLARFEHAAPFSELLCLGDVATRFAGDALEYDPLGGRVLNHTEANQALSYEYRKGWRL